MVGLTLVGECNQCGLCCFLDDLKCGHLIVTGTPGEPCATACGVRGTREDGMKIPMVNGEGVVVRHAFCAKDSPNEVDGILEKGIGKGCSMEVKTQMEVNHG